MLKSVQWQNPSTVTIPRNETNEQVVEYTRGAMLDSASMLDSGYIIDAKLAIHGSTGKQLLPFTVDRPIPSVNKIITITPKNDGMESVCTERPADSANFDVYFVGNAAPEWESGYEFCETLTPGNYNAKITSVNSDLSLYVIAWRHGKYTILCDTSREQNFTVNDGDKFRIFVRPNERASQESLNTTFQVIIQKAEYNSKWEVFTGGTPYTDKYTATITDQTENNVTLSIENVSASEGDSTELYVVLTDIFGVSKRSEVGKTFIGGGEST